MSENEIRPDNAVAPETAETAERSEAAEESETSVTLAAEAGPTATTEAAPSEEGVDVVPAPAETAASAPAPRKAEGGRKSKAGVPEKGKGKPKAKRPVGRRSEDVFVKPSPEELALVPSEIVRAAIDNQAYVEGKVIGWNQGGFHVVVDGITGFCPRSSMELGAPKEPAQYLDQSYLFRVLRVEEKGHRLVVSRAAVLRDEQRAPDRRDCASRSTLGASVTGKVLSLTDFGAFVDLGGDRGTAARLRDPAHARRRTRTRVLKVGDEVTAKIIKLPKGGERISLSMKALEPDPWQGVANAVRRRRQVHRQGDAQVRVRLVRRARAGRRRAAARLAARPRHEGRRSEARPRRDDRGLGARSRSRRGTASRSRCARRRRAIRGRASTRSTPRARRSPAPSRRSRSSAPSSCSSPA